jgi:ferredoxin
MAKVINNINGNQQNVEDGFPIRMASEKLGVPFGCRDGLCGTCMIDIIEGEENLNELNQKELDLMRDKTHRLACQCKIKQGLIKIEF